LQTQDAGRAEAWKRTCTLSTARAVGPRLGPYGCGVAALFSLPLVSGEAEAHTDQENIGTTRRSVAEFVSFNSRKSHFATASALLGQQEHSHRSVSLTWRALPCTEAPHRWSCHRHLDQPWRASVGLPRCGYGIAVGVLEVLPPRRGHAAGVGSPLRKARGVGSIVHLATIVRRARTSDQRCRAAHRGRVPADFPQDGETQP